MSYVMYKLMSFDAAAEEIVKNPYEDPRDILRKYDIYYDELTEAEIDYLNERINYFER